MEFSPPINILVADRHELIRIGLRTVFGGHQDLQIVAETDNFNQTLQLASKLKPNVILFDAQLNDGDCLDQIPILSARSPQSKILFFTDNAQEDIHLHALRLGVAGIVPKYQSSALLIKAIQAVN
ncbi:MAG: response regulator, partial [Methylobacter sp.]